VGGLSVATILETALGKDLDVMMRRYGNTNATSDRNFLNSLSMKLQFTTVITSHASYLERSTLHTTILSTADLSSAQDLFK
jgi:hypothetical protein